MRHLLLISLSFISLFSSVSSCAEQAKPVQKNWTVLIYVNLGDGFASDHSPEDLGDEDKDTDDYVIKLLEKTGSTDKMNIIVERPYLKDKYTTRIQIEKSTDPDKVTSPVIQNLGFVDMGNYLTLQDFVEWGIKNYPAQHYMVIANVHGDGWYDARENPSISSTAKTVKRVNTRFTMSKDNYTDSVITSPQLGNVMRHAAELIGHKVDILALDSCHMLDIETATELADSTRFVIGSEDKLNSEAWPYEKLSAQIAKTPSMLPAQILKIAMDDIADLYKNPPNKDEQQTFAVLDTQSIQELNQAIGKLAYNIAAIKSGEDLQKISQAQSKALSMMDSRTHYDLLDFIKELQRSQIQSLDQNNLIEIEKMLNEIVIHKFINTSIYKDEEYNSRYRQLGGIGIWLAGQTYNANAMKNYHQLQFDIDTKWGLAIASWSKPAG